MFPERRSEVDFEIPPLEKGYEWVDGRPREKPGGMRAAFVGCRLLCRLQNYCEEACPSLAVLSASCGYRLWTEEPLRVRRASFSCVCLDHFPHRRLPGGHSRIAPELACDVVPPGATAEQVERRLADFLIAGTKLYWVVYPETRSVWIVRQDGSAARLVEGQELSGEDAIPGFVCPVAALFTRI